MRYRLIFALAVLTFLFSGCNQKALLQKFIPETEDRFARQFLERVLNDHVDEALSMVDPAFQNPRGRKGLEQLVNFFHGRNVETIENIGVSTRFSYASGKTLRSVEL